MAAGKSKPSPRGKPNGPKAAKRENKENAVPQAGDLPAATLDEFFQFLQCQIRKEAEVHMESSLDLKDAAAESMWPHYEAFVKPNLGATERWVPFHTILGVHEKFLVEAVHHADYGWDERARFLAIFIFRAHCKADLFMEAQLKILQKVGFWDDPLKAFEVEGEMEHAILEYRRKTRKPLLTICFRMIPERTLEDGDSNLVRSIILRTQTLLGLAVRMYPIIKDAKLSADAKFAAISSLIQEAQGLGETWAKMLMVCVDLAYPKLGLLASQCEVGIGAQTPLRRLLPNGGPADIVDALGELRKAFNTSKTDSARNFWALLQIAENRAQSHFKHLPLILEQTRTKEGDLSAVTLQVQLCEYRQFRHAIARQKYGLPHDDSMKEPEKEKRLKLEDFLERDEEKQLLNVRFPPKDKDADPIEFTVALTAVTGNWRLAERIAMHCFHKWQAGASKAEVEQLRVDLCSQCVAGAEDVSNDSAAWDLCRAQLAHSSPLVSFSYQAEGDCKKVPFQTTVKAAGNVMEAERMARLCYERFVQGASKDEVLAYRTELYAAATKSAIENRTEAGQPAPKKRRST